MIDFKKLRAFIAVAEELNFHRAADRLNTVQSALTRMIQSLERETGASLLRRSTRRVELTSAGKSFLDDARNMLAQLESMVQAARGIAEGKTGTLSLAYMDFAVHRILPELMSVVARKAPGIRVNLTYMSTAQQRDALAEGRVDLGIMIGEVINPDVESRLLAEEPVVVALPKRHPLSNRRHVNLAQIADENLVLGASSEWAAFRQIVFDLYGREGRVPRIAHEASSAPALMGLVAGGMGLSFYAGIPRLYQTADVAFVPLKPRTGIPILAAWRRDVNSPLLRQVLQIASWI